MIELSDVGQPGWEKLEQAIKAEDTYLQSYCKPSEILTYETVRALDDFFCRDLMEPSRRVSATDNTFRALSTWGINRALRSIIPREMREEPFYNFPSTERRQVAADDFIFHCGIRTRAAMLASAVRDGVLSCKVRPYPEDGEAANMTDILVLKAVGDSYFEERIGHAGLRWSSARQTAQDRAEESKLEKKHRRLEKRLDQSVRLVNGWLPESYTPPEIDTHFQEWARLYLRRIHSQDMIGYDERIGGRPFSSYVDVLTVLSAKSQHQIANAAILKARHPLADLRNLLTTFAHRSEYLDSVARHLDADAGEVAEIMTYFTLSGSNLDLHTAEDDTAWPPLIQASANTLIRPVFGIDINPFLFLMRELRSRHEGDWFRVANTREQRWIEELKSLYQHSRWQTHGQNLKLKRNGKVLTDLDFAVLDSSANELAIFQLKWQFPVGADQRGRRSTAKNFQDECNKWIERVTSWLQENGSTELAKRLGFEASGTPSVQLFVLGRYHAHYSGYSLRDTRAVWSDWAHFKRARVEGPRKSMSQLARELQRAIVRTRERNKTESTMFPVGTLALVINPTSEPDDDAFA